MAHEMTLAVRDQNEVVSRAVSFRQAYRMIQDKTFLDREPGWAGRVWQAAPLVSFAPAHRGMVILDRDTHWVGSLMLGRHPEAFSTHSLLSGFDHQMRADESDEFRPPMAQEFFDAALARGEVTQVKILNDDETFSWKPFGSLGMDPLQPERLHDHLLENDRIAAFNYAPKGWVLESWSCHPDDGLGFSKAVAERGFSLSSEGGMLWRQGFALFNELLSEGALQALDLHRLSTQVFERHLMGDMPPARPGTSRRL